MSSAVGRVEHREYFRVGDWAGRLEEEGGRGERRRGRGGGGRADEEESEEGCEREEELDGRTGERCREKKGRGRFFFDRVGIRESIAAEKERR